MNKTIKFQMMMSPEEAREIDRWGLANHIRSRAEAIRVLCGIGMDAKPLANISPEICRAARGFLDWSQIDLAQKSELSESTVRDFEKGRRIPGTNSLAAIRKSLSDGGAADFLAKLDAAPPSDEVAPDPMSALCEQLVDDVARGAPYPEARAVISEECRRGRVDLHAVLGRRRDRELVAARRAIASRMREELHMTLPAIGRMLNRDHSTIVNLLKKRSATKYRRRLELERLSNVLS